MDSETPEFSGYMHAIARRKALLFGVAIPIAILAILLAVTATAFRVTQTRQMVRQYPWLYTRAGPLNWRKVGREDLPGR